MSMAWRHPLVDLIVSDPYKDLTARVRSGEYLGTGYVLETKKCHHLAFRQDSVDWQLWVEDGPNPLPRKVVITQKDSPTRAQYVAIISNWNLSAEHADDAFMLDPPAWMPVESRRAPGGAGCPPKAGATSGEHDPR